MTGSRDYRDEMHAQRELDDATVEAVLRGGPVPADLEPLAAALGALRNLPEQPVRPSAELAARMATGDFASAAAPRPSRRSAGRYASRRRRAPVSLRAKVAVGSALALGGLATATAAGALPEEAQRGVQSVIEIVTPFEFAEPDDFGRDVSDDAKDGGVDGQDVNEKAREQGNQPDEPGDLTGSDIAPPNGNPSSDRAATPNVPSVRPTDGPPDDPPGKPAEPVRPDETGKPESADDRPNELPVEPRSAD